MKKSDTGKAIDDILDALDQERDVIRSGRLNGLADMVESRERALEALKISADSKEPAIIRGVAEISRRAKRNAGLLEAAIKGVKAAEKRLADIFEARTTLGTYEKDGTKSLGPVSESAIRKRA